LKRWANIVLAGTGLLLVLASQGMPPLRRAGNPIAGEVEAFYVGRALEDMATPNVVTAILADYRGYDTFGETTVIFAAGLSCFLLLRRFQG
jgi:multicomponent Na+:H+ antiporter subunit B